MSVLRLRSALFGSTLVCVLAAACATESSELPGAAAIHDAGSSPSASSSSGGSDQVPDAAPRTDAGTGTGTGYVPPECGASALATNPWIDAQFAAVPQVTGSFTKRQFVELPVRVHDASVSGAKYGFDFDEAKDPVDPRVALVNVRITDLVSPDGFGASFQTAGASGAQVFLSNVYLEPNWPHWVGYASTNYDGMVLDDSEEIFAEDVTVKNWNADCAADIKSKRAQFVCLKTEGDGNRTLRFWNIGPHYLVKSSVNNAAGDIVWMEQCEGAKIFVYDSTFNGEPQLPADKISCHHGASPEIVYLTVDPRTTGEMHPMFSAR